MLSALYLLPNIEELPILEGTPRPEFLSLLQHRPQLRPVAIDLSPYLEDDAIRFLEDPQTCRGIHLHAVRFQGSDIRTIREYDADYDANELGTWLSSGMRVACLIWCPAQQSLANIMEVGIREVGEIRVNTRFRNLEWEIGDTTTCMEYLARLVQSVGIRSHRIRFTFSDWNACFTEPLHSLVPHFPGLQHLTEAEVRRSAEDTLVVSSYTLVGVTTSNSTDLWNAEQWTVSELSCEYPGRLWLSSHSLLRALVRSCPLLERLVLRVAKSLIERPAELGQTELNGVSQFSLCEHNIVSFNDRSDSSHAGSDFFSYVGTVGYTSSPTYMSQGVIPLTLSR